MRFLISFISILILCASANAQHIVIDPGHGGTDPGGTGNAMEEKEVVLDISLRFAKLLEDDTSDTGGGGSWTVSLSRDTDVFISLAARSSFANSMGADRFMSIHSNAFGDPQANGTETFSLSESGDGARLRELVQEEVIAAWGLRDRGNKTANFSVLSNTAMPAELHELGFITNATDVQKLASPEERQKAAEAHLRAIQRHYSIAPYIPDPNAIEDVGHLQLLITSDTGPIAGASLLVDNTAHDSRSDTNGQILVSDLSPGEHVFAVSAAGYKDSQTTFTTTVNIVAEETITLEKSVTGECDPSLEDCEAPDGEDGGCGCSSGTNSNSGILLLIALCLLYLRKSKRRVSRRAPLR